MSNLPPLRASRRKIVVVMPAFNAARTLGRTYAALPHDLIDRVILVDDGSSDGTAGIARDLGIDVIVHSRNRGYGANQKTCYRESLKAGAQIIVMVHPDYQYDPSVLPDLVRPVDEERAEVVMGSRFLGSDPVKDGMPWWKYLGNRFLTRVENRVFGLRLSEYHTGYRAYHRKALEAVPFDLNSDRFVFDQEILAQMLLSGMRIAEVPVPVRYFPEASSASLRQSLVYGVSTLWLLLRFVAHRCGLFRSAQFTPPSKTDCPR